MLYYKLGSAAALHAKTCAGHQRRNPQEAIPLWRFQYVKHAWHGSQLVGQDVCTNDQMQLQTHLAECSWSSCSALLASPPAVVIRQCTVIRVAGRACAGPVP